MSEQDDLLHNAVVVCEVIDTYGRRGEREAWDAILRALGLDPDKVWGLL